MNIPDSFHALRELEPVGGFASPAFIRRHPGNPVLRASDVPYPATLVFNCSVWKEGAEYLMVFRNDFSASGKPNGLGATNFGLARSRDGVAWRVDPEPIFQYRTDDRYRIGRVYDPRITVLEGRYYLTCCAESKYGVQAATFVSDDLRHFERIDLSLPNSRNTLLFPEKIGGKYYRLERPFTSDLVGVLCEQTGRWLGERFHTWISCSEDLVHWGENDILIDVDDVPYANTKVGPGAVPIRTERGWLLLIHGVDFDPARGKNGWEPTWKSRYHAGVALLDLHDPRKVVGLGRAPLLTPEAPYETGGGYRNNVIFPMAGICEDDGSIKIYYGAADAVICLATARLDDVLNACEPFEQT